MPHRKGSGILCRISAGLRGGGVFRGRGSPALGTSWRRRGWGGVGWLAGVAAVVGEFVQQRWWGGGDGTRGR